MSKKNRVCEQCQESIVFEPSHDFCDPCRNRLTLLSELEKEMRAAGFAPIMSVRCPRCLDTLVYMNAQGSIRCPSCEEDKDFSSLSEVLYCEKCTMLLDRNYEIEGRKCLCGVSTNVVVATHEALKAKVPQILSARLPHHFNPIHSENILRVKDYSARQRLKEWGIPLAIALVIVGLLFSITFPPISSSVDSEEEAIAVCQVQVKNALKDPGSAKFEESSAERSNDGWVSTGIVRAKNSFGAFDSRTYVCVIDLEGVSVSVR